MLNPEMIANLVPRKAGQREENRDVFLKFYAFYARLSALMTYFTSWEEFARAAERLYLANPIKCRYVTKYRPEGVVVVKMTDDQVCLKYKTEHAQDVKKLEKFSSQLMRLMASKEGK